MDKIEKPLPDLKGCLMLRKHCLFHKMHRPQTGGGCGHFSKQGEIQKKLTSRHFPKMLLKEVFLSDRGSVWTFLKAG